MLIVYNKSNRLLAKAISSELSIDSIEINIFKFSNGEFYGNQDNSNNIKDDHIIILFPNNQNINDSIIEFITIANIYKNYKLIDAIIPYIPYSRQDKSENIQIIFKILNLLNINRIITIDIHNTNLLSYKNIYNILPHEIFGNDLIYKDDLIIISPDIGALDRSSKMAEYLKCDMILIDKKSKIFQNLDKVKNKNCIIVDDIIDSGNTINFSKDLLKQNDSKSISVYISHKPIIKYDNVDLDNISFPTCKQLSKAIIKKLKIILS